MGRGEVGKQKAKGQHTQVAVVVSKEQSSRGRLPTVDIHIPILAGEVYRSEGACDYGGGVQQEQDRRGLVQQASLRFVPKKTHHFLTGLLPRKKIDGAIAVCQQDPLRLIRTDTPVFGSFYTQHVLHCLFISPHGVSWNFLSIYSGYLKDVS